MRVLLGLILVHSVAGRGILYPRESESREVRELNGIWEFRLANESVSGIKEKWFAKKLSASGPTIPMPVPSSYNDITQDKDVREHVGYVWYERTFFVPNSWRDLGLRVWLRFGSAHYFAYVWLNGQKVAAHEIGHLPFQAEITTHVHYGAENRLTVALDNTLTQTTVPQGSLDKIYTINGPKVVQRYTFDFFNYAGIHRTVHLYTTPSIYIDDITVYTDVAGSKGLLYYNVSYNGGAGSDSINCKVNILDADNNPIGKYSKEEKVGTWFVGKIEIPHVNLWWPYLMHPNPGYLYTFEAKISEAQWEIEDTYRMPVGVRTIHWTNTSLLINNKPVYLRGFGRHEDSDIRGKGFDWALVTKDYNLLKWVGANSYRTSHYPYAEEIMDMADQQGIMIIDECPSVDTDKFSPALLEKHKDSLTQLIQRDKNRPSVIMWSVANEPRTQYPESADYFRSVVEHVKMLDSKRPVTAVLNRWFSVDQAAQFMDIIGFNRYNGWYTEPGKTEVIQINVESEAEHWHVKHNKPVIMMEYGADTMEGLHFQPDYIWSEEYQLELLSEHFKAFDNLRRKGFFIGEMIWNFADFKTDQSTTRVGGNKKGIFTRARQPKSSAQLVRKRNFQLAYELDAHDLPLDLERYTSFSVTNNRVEL